MRKLKKEIWPYQIILPYKDNQDLSCPDYTSRQKWCKEYLGIRFKDWYDYGAESGHIYAFRDEETLLMFKLKWNYI